MLFTWHLWLTKPEVPTKGSPGLELLLRLHVVPRDGTSENTKTRNTCSISHRVKFSRNRGDCVSYATLQRETSDAEGPLLAETQQVPDCKPSTTRVFNKI